MNVVNYVGSRLTFSARCASTVRANYSVVVTAPHQLEHDTFTNSSHDSGTEGLVGELVQEVDAPIHQPHPPFDLSTQSYQSSSPYPGVRPNRTLAGKLPHERPVVSASNRVMTRLFSSNGDIVPTLKFILPDQAAATSTTKKRKSKKKIIQVKTAPRAKPEAPGAFAPLYEDGVKVKQSDTRPGNKSSNSFGLKSAWKGEDWQENWGDDSPYFLLACHRNTPRPPSQSSNRRRNHHRNHLN
jgi:hypothetical protein